MMEKDAKIYVAGHRGMVGSAIVRELRRQGYTNIITRTIGFDPSRSGGKVLCGGETGICVPCRSQSGRYRSQPVGIGGFYV